MQIVFDGISMMEGLELLLVFPTAPALSCRHGLSTLCIVRWAASLANITAGQRLSWMWHQQIALSLPTLGGIKCSSVGSADNRSTALASAGRKFQRYLSQLQSLAAARRSLLR